MKQGELAYVIGEGAATRRAAAVGAGIGGWRWACLDKWGGKAAERPGLGGVLGDGVVAGRRGQELGRRCGHALPRLALRWPCCRQRLQASGLSGLSHSHTVERPRAGAHHPAQPTHAQRHTPLLSSSPSRNLFGQQHQ